MLEKVKSYLPILTIGIIVLALFKQILYYRYFNFSILSFLGFQEITLYIIEDLFILIPLLLVIFINNKITDRSRELKMANKPVSKTVITLYKFFVAILFFALVLLVGTSAVVKLTEDSSFQSVTTVVLSLSTVLIPMFMVIALNTRMLGPITKNQYDLMYLIIACLFFAAIRSLMLKYEVDEGKYTGTYIKTPTKEHTSSDTSFYIGKTEKYLFIYNTNDRSTDIIPTDDIVDFKLKSK